MKLSTVYIILASAVTAGIAFAVIVFITLDLWFG
jgi:hypothetical protein